MLDRIAEYRERVEVYINKTPFVLLFSFSLVTLTTLEYCRRLIVH